MDCGFTSTSIRNGFWALTMAPRKVQRSTPVDRDKFKGDKVREAERIVVVAVPIDGDYDWHREAGDERTETLSPTRAREIEMLEGKGK